MAKLYVTSVNSVQLTPDYTLAGIYTRPEQAPYSVDLTTEQAAVITATSGYKNLKAAGTALVDTNDSPDEDELKAIWAQMKADTNGKWGGPGDFAYMAKAEG